MKAFRYYILDEKGEPVGTNDLMRWASMFEYERAARVVKQEKVGKYKVSTVFLGLDHNWSLKGPPVLWETMVFGEGRLNNEMDRCPGSREQAMAMHNRMVEEVKAHCEMNQERKS